MNQVCPAFKKKNHSAILVKVRRLRDGGVAQCLCRGEEGEREEGRKKGKGRKGEEKRGEG
jgi:hypothetical protein